MEMSPVADADMAPVGSARGFQTESDHPKPIAHPNGAFWHAPPRRSSSTVTPLTSALHPLTRQCYPALSLEW